MIKFFRITKAREEDIHREKECIERIKQRVMQKSGTNEFIQYDDLTIAFAGSKDNMELMLEICTQQSNGERFLYASVDDEVSWQEWDFDNLYEFESEIVKYISDRVNRTIKTVVQKVKHKSYEETVYYLNEEINEWVLLERDMTQNKLACFFAATKTEKIETVKTYKIES